jgi:hypothetical protein
LDKVVAVFVVGILDLLDEFCGVVVINPLPRTKVLVVGVWGEVEIPSAGFLMVVGFFVWSRLWG